MNKIIHLTDHLSSSTFHGDDGFDDFLAHGGAETDEEVVAFLKRRMSVPDGLSLRIEGMQCSSAQAQSEDGYIFGRNFDWDDCHALNLLSIPSKGYTSISTVNTDYIAHIDDTLSEEDLAFIAHYAPIDGMNEKGLCISVNMVPEVGERTLLHQTDPGKPNLQNSTAVRLLLNRAANVHEAVSLLNGVNLHCSFDYTTHFMIADAAGASVAVEYIDNRMIVTEAKALTNVWISPGDLFDRGKEEAKIRYRILIEALAAKSVMTMEGVRDMMKAARRSQVLPDKITQWTMICDQTNLTVHYFIREDYDQRFVFSFPYRVCIV